MSNPVDADGRARGCRAPGSVAIGIPGVKTKDVGGLLPAWVQATTRPGHPETAVRTVEGEVVRSHISGEDFPLDPWHESYDWNFHVRPDPQFRGLLSTVNVAEGGTIECEWETKFFPTYAWPEVGHRVWVVGRWIYDCAHPRNGNQYHTEIHPPKAVMSIRSEAVSFGGAPPVRANNAILYIGRRGGYVNQDINDQDYRFSLPLPPRPTPQAVARIRIVPRRPAQLPVQPRVTPAPAAAPTRLDVVIPLRGVQPHPVEYGAVISGGWSDPTGREAKAIQHVRVIVETLFMDADKDSLGRDEWYVYVGTNGRWRVYESLSGKSATLNHQVDLDLHTGEDTIRIAVNGYEADTVHDLMGKGVAVPRRLTSERSTTAEARDAAGKIRNAFGLNINENDILSRIRVTHPPSTRGTFTEQSPGKGYRIRYTIQDRP